MKIIRLLLLILLHTNNAFAEGARNWQFGFQKPATPIMKELYNFHNFLLIIDVIIVILVISLLTYVCIRFNATRNPIPAKFTQHVVIETIWTIIPVIILIIIAIPSFRILSFVEKTPPAEMTVKIVGYQWYWHYIYPDHGGFEFDSYIVDPDILGTENRLLTVDNRMVVPENTVIKFLITAGDVIHSFAVPAFGIKTDAVPGRVNETWAKITRTGVFYGQCSELCGVNHGFMPIVIEVVTKEEFENWICLAKKKFANLDSLLQGHLKQLSSNSFKVYIKDSKDIVTVNSNKKIIPM